MKLIVSELGTFVSVKDYADKFVADRLWDIFHQPKNLALALAGNKQITVLVLVTCCRNTIVLFYIFYALRL
jgi:hypothetical protein